MKTLITILLMLAAYQSTSASAEVIDPSKYMIKLVDYSLDATASLNRILSCSAPEVKDGVINHVSFDPKFDNAWRDLVPTSDPLANKASWLLNDRGCANNYYNGVGFDSYNPTTGYAAIFVTSFVDRPFTTSAWNNSDELGRLALIFHPRFDMQNTILFRAKCELKNDNILSGFGYGETTGVCKFAAGGEIHFALKKKGG